MYRSKYRTHFLFLFCTTLTKYNILLLWRTDFIGRKMNFCFPFLNKNIFVESFLQPVIFQVGMAKAIPFLTLPAWLENDRKCNSTANVSCETHKINLITTWNFLPTFTYGIFFCNFKLVSNQKYVLWRRKGGLGGRGGGGGRRLVFNLSRSYLHIAHWLCCGTVFAIPFFFFRYIFLI